MHLFRRFNKFIATVLVVTITITSFSTVFAEERLSETSSGSDSSTIQTETQELQDNSANSAQTGSEEAQKSEPNIVSEVCEKREENSKEFLMSDGSYMIAQYGFPIHYQDKSNQWQDFDNSMEKVSEDISISKSTKSISNNLSSASRSASETINEYKNKKSNKDFRLANIAKSSKMVSVKVKDYMVSWGYTGINNKVSRR